MGKCCCLLFVAHDNKATVWAVPVAAAAVLLLQQCFAADDFTCTTTMHRTVHPLRTCLPPSSLSAVRTLLSTFG
jgi:hypothetical protein